MDREYRVIVAHPGKQHSYQTIKALNREGINLTYITTVYDKPTSFTGRLKGLFLKGDNLKRANSRVCPWIDDNRVIQFCELSALVTLLLLRIDKSKKIYRVWNDMVFSRFGKKVAQYAVNADADLVIMFDANAKPCFEYLSRKAPSIIKVLDVSIATRPYQKAVYEENIKLTGLKGLKSEQIFLWNEKRQDYYKKEIGYSDYFMCPSEFVKKSLNYCGAKDNQIMHVPYGVQVERFAYTPRKSGNGPLKMVMAGQVNYRKGFHHMINVLKKFKSEEVKLILFGADNCGDPFFEENKHLDNIEYRGFVTQDKIIEEYKQSDIYVFPSLCEGLSLSVLEAMSCGLPVLLSDHSGANDVVIEKENGLVFTAGNDKAFESCIRWFINNRERLPYMGEQARKTAITYSWDSYYENYYNKICSILRQKK